MSLTPATPAVLLSCQTHPAVDGWQFLIINHVLFELTISSECARIQHWKMFLCEEVEVGAGHIRPVPQTESRFLLENQFAIFYEHEIHLIILGRKMSS